MGKGRVFKSAVELEREAGHRHFERAKRLLVVVAESLAAIQTVEAKLRKALDEMTGEV